MCTLGKIHITNENWKGAVEDFEAVRTLRICQISQESSYCSRESDAFISNLRTMSIGSLSTAAAQAQYLEASAMLILSYCMLHHIEEGLVTADQYIALLKRGRIQLSGTISSEFWLSLGYYHQAICFIESKMALTDYPKEICFSLSNSLSFGAESVPNNTPNHLQSVQILLAQYCE